MKNILFLICILLRFSLAGQVGTIKVKKPKNCDFKLIADKNLINKKFEIGGVAISGYEDSNVLVKCGLGMAQTITISHDTLEFYLRNICDTPNYKLISVAITKPFEQKNIFIQLVLKDKELPPNSSLDK